MLTGKYQLNNFREERFWRLAINFCLAVLLAYVLASLTWRLIGPSKEMRPGGTSLKTGLKPTASTSQRAMVVTRETDLFGKAGRVKTSPVPLDQNSTSAPPTSLSLVLKGIIVAEPMSRALAAIAEKGGKQEKLYGIGDKVPGNGVITEILIDRVILRRGGILETLMLLDKKSSLAGARATKRARSTGQKITSRGDGVHWQIDKSYLNQRLADIPSLAREVGVEIYKENNVQKGLQPGDVLHEVNGVPLNSVHDGLSAYQNLRNAKRVQVVITRNGRRETKIYEINNGG
jgi:general secretion pathway protein C